MSTFAADTSVAVERTRAELEQTLQRFGADAFGYMIGDGKAMIQFRASGRHVRFTLPIPSPTEKRFTEYRIRGCIYSRAPGQARKEWDQACRSAWRALFLCVKAKLVAVDAKITTFEEEFMAHIILPNGMTAGEEVLPLIGEAYATGKMPTFQLAITNG